jgi:hypothetical protein
MNSFWKILVKIFPILFLFIILEIGYLSWLSVKDKLGFIASIDCQKITYQPDDQVFFQNNTETIIAGFNKKFSGKSIEKTGVNVTLQKNKCFGMNLYSSTNVGKPEWLAYYDRTGNIKIISLSYNNLPIIDSIPKN